jgi:hypothetical protein
LGDKKSKTVSLAAAVNQGLLLVIVHSSDQPISHYPVCTAFQKFSKV